MPDTDLLGQIFAAGPGGLSPQALSVGYDGSRSTLNRQLAQMLKDGRLKAMGAGRTTRYASTTAFTREAIDVFFSRSWQERPVALFDESLLSPTINIDIERANRLTQIQALAQPIDKRFLARFLVDFAWGSSVLEGSTYSALDTEALIQYGQKNNAKPTEDAVLALNHKQAGEFLWTHQELNTANVLEMHALLTDDHDISEVADSDHFLKAHQRGKPREYDEVNLGASAYMPPFRPGTGFVAQAFTSIINTANTLHPVQAALYLMTRIPYLQAFANGNKRTSRIAANAPLLAHGLLPMSFVDTNKADYIRGMAAFYELGSLHVIEQNFIQSYAKSVVRSSNIPRHLRATGFDLNTTASGLCEFVNTGRRPNEPELQIFLAFPAAPDAKEDDPTPQPSP